jgi:hypothetical protein
MCSSPYLLSLLNIHDLPYWLPVIFALTWPILSKVVIEAHHPKDGFCLHHLGEEVEEARTLLIVEID